MCLHLNFYLVGSNLVDLLKFAPQDKPAVHRCTCGEKKLNHDIMHEDDEEEEDGDQNDDDDDDDDGDQNDNKSDQPCPEVTTLLDETLEHSADRHLYLGLQFTVITISSSYPPPPSSSSYPPPSSSSAPPDQT